MNKDVFARLNIQMATAVRLRMQRTMQLLRGEAVDPYRCLFIDPAAIAPGCRVTNMESYLSSLTGPIRRIPPGSGKWELDKRGGDENAESPDTSTGRAWLPGRLRSVARAVAGLLYWAHERVLRHSCLILGAGGWGRRQSPTIPRCEEEAVPMAMRALLWCCRGRSTTSSCCGSAGGTTSGEGRRWAEPHERFMAGRRAGRRHMVRWLGRCASYGGRWPCRLWSAWLATIERGGRVAAFVSSVSPCWVGAGCLL